MELLIIILLLIIAAEVSYLVWTNTAKITKGSARKVFVDTSVLIDGRIIELAKSGVIGDLVYIPRSVVGELQLLADGSDSDKRTRARHGLDVIAELQALDSVNVEIFSDSTEAREGVDNRLLALAKQYHGALMTIDYNLAKVAVVEGIVVININDIAKNLRMTYMPGERIMLALTVKGNDSGQAVGHLEDGTMVVVEQARSKVGTTVEVEIIRSLQTSAGRMMFAKLVGQQPQKQQKQQKLSKTQKTQSADRQAPKSREQNADAGEAPAPEQPSAKRQRPTTKSASSRVKQNTAAPNDRKKQSPQTSQSNEPTNRSRRPSKKTPRRQDQEDRLIALLNDQSE